MSRVFQILNQTRHQYGWSAAGRLLIDRLGARLCDRHVMEVVWLDLNRAEACSPVPGFEFRFLTAIEVRDFSSDPSMDLEPGIADEVDAGHSQCFAALFQGHLAAYGWYALHQADPRHCFDVGLLLPSDVSYMFKGFTHPDYRGKRLHAAAMAGALSELSHRGIRGLISTVEWTNEASLRSCDRLGYRRLGRIVQSGPANRRKVTIPANIQPSTGVRFVPASQWKAASEEIPATCDAIGN